MNTEIDINNKLKGEFLPNHFDESIGFQITEESKIGSSKAKQRIISANFNDVLLDNHQKIALRQKKILEEIVKFNLVSTLEPEIVPEQPILVCTQQYNLPLFECRLTSKDSELEAYVNHNLLNKQPSQHLQSLKQNRCRSDSKAFSKIKSKKQEQICQNEEYQNNENITEEKLKNELQDLLLKMDQAKQSLKRQQEVWLSRQETLKQLLQQKERLANDYWERIKNLQTENKLLNKQIAIKAKKKSEQSSQQSYQNSKSQTINFREDNKKSVQKDIQNLSGQRQAVSCKQTQKKSTNDLENSTQKNLYQLSRILNKLKKQLNDPQKKRLRLKIAGVL